MGVQYVAAPAQQAPPPPLAAPEAKAEETSASKMPSGQVTIDSPMVGTFYASSAPGEAPMVLPGDSITKDKTICIVEAMKIMNEVAAKFPCIIERVLVENGEPVEFGQPLFAVRPLA